MKERQTSVITAASWHLNLQALQLGVEPRFGADPWAKSAEVQDNGLVSSGRARVYACSSSVTMKMYMVKECSTLHDRQLGCRRKEAGVSAAAAQQVIIGGHGVNHILL